VLDGVISSNLFGDGFVARVTALFLAVTSPLPQTHSLKVKGSGETKRMSAQERREMIQQCRRLKAKITEGNTSNDVADEYRLLKQKIRDSAAIQIQALFRGYLARKPVTSRFRERRRSELASQASPVVTRGSNSEIRPALAVALAERPSADSPNSPTSPHTLKIHHNKASSFTLPRPDEKPEKLTVSTNDNLDLDMDLEPNSPTKSPQHRSSDSTGSTSISPPSSTTNAGSMSPTSRAALVKEIESQRAAAGRVLPFDDWPLKALLAEKKAVKSALAKKNQLLSKKLGRELSKADKEVYRPVYELYHKLKALIKAKSVEKDKDKDKDKKKKSPHSQTASPSLSASVALTQLTTQQLLAEKKALQIKLNQFEKQFQKLKGRNIKYQSDILPVRAEWNRYKFLKSQLEKQQP